MQVLFMLLLAVPISIALLQACCSHTFFTSSSLHFLQFFSKYNIHHTEKLEYGKDNFSEIWLIAGVSGSGSTLNVIYIMFNLGVIYIMFNLGTSYLLWYSHLLLLAWLSWGLVTWTKNLDVFIDPSSTSNHKSHSIIQTPFNFCGTMPLILSIVSLNSHGLDNVNNSSNKHHAKDFISVLFLLNKHLVIVYDLHLCSALLP